jgi:8-oxo-dGTP diphosphatase
MHDATLCLLLKDNQVYLATKKETKSFGGMHFNGYGGTVEDNETIEDSALRELLEEAKVVAKKSDLNKVAIISFYFTNAPKGKDWDQTVHVYFLKRWEGEPLESYEMNAPQLFDFYNLPLNKMWDADKHWMPHVFLEKK